MAAVPTPKEHFGYEMGTEKKLATYEEIADYFKKLEKSYRPHDSSAVRFHHDGQADVPGHLLKPRKFEEGSTTTKTSIASSRWAL